jgi:hypothetical protein
MYKIQISNSLAISLEYNIFIENKLYRVYAKYPETGLTLDDPFLIALTLFEYNNETIENYKHALEKKILQYFKNKIPYFEIFYVLTGGKQIWSKMKWSNKIIDYWQEDLDELIKDCISIYDLILVFKYFKYEIIQNRLEYMKNFINITEDD